MTTKSGAVIVAKKLAARSGVNAPFALSTGVEARFTPVSISIITEAQSAIPDPPVPIWHNESKGTDEPNPNHPDYLKALERIDSERNLAAIDAMVMFGVELVNGVPEDGKWLKTLKLRQKMGLSNVDLSIFDLEDEIELEFLYKKYFAVAAADIAGLMKMSGVKEEDIEEAMKSFPDNEE